MKRLLLLLLLAASPALATNYYISPSGSDTNGCTDQGADACASFPRCAEVMAAGDTCYALDGTYLVTDTDPTSHPNSGWVFNFVSAGSPSARYRFTSLSQDATKVIIKRAGSDSATMDTWKIVGGVGGSDRRGENIEIDHVTLEGRMSSYATYEDIQYHHNICRCPNTGTGGGNQSCFYTARSSSDMHVGINMYESLFLYEASCPARGSNTNIQFIDTYDMNGAVIEKNDFVNTDPARSMYSFVWMKRMNKDIIIRNNFFDGSAASGDGAGIWLMDCDGEFYWGQSGDRSAQGGSATCNDKVYQNIIYGVGDGIMVQDSGVQKQFVYNNTIVAPETRCFGGTWDRSKHCDNEVPPAGGACTSDATCSGGTCIDDPVPVATDYEAFNNICYATSNKQMFHWETYSDTNYSCMSDQDYVDNNMYYPTGTYSQKYADCYTSVSGDATYSTLAAWQTHNLAAGMEQNSREADPLFTDYANKDFTLQAGSPARSGGRNAGGYSAVLGAYITGSEQIGCSFHPDCYSAGVAAPGPTPSVSRVDLKGVNVKTAPANRTALDLPNTTYSTDNVGLFAPGINFNPNGAGGEALYKSELVDGRNVRWSNFAASARYSTDLATFITNVRLTQADDEWVQENHDRIIIPIVYMPDWLSACTTGCDTLVESPAWYAKNTYGPSDYEVWEDMVESFVTYWAVEHPAETGKTPELWFEVWNKPDFHF